MDKVCTTKMSSKGQVVIPEEVRERLGLKPGTRFVVVGTRDVIILKALSVPSMSDFDELVRESRKRARKAGLKRSDVAAAIKEVRRRG
jgi:AbrB family looped-hinge helix DNA binding protein